jgi:hypothetical protein
VAYRSFQSRQKCYRRVSLSCHITYLTLNSYDALESKEDLLDRATIFPFEHYKGVTNPSDVYLFKAASSVLLTLVIPEESKSREEEVDLLRTPQALWTLLVVNCLSEFSSDHGPGQYLTPIAQYIRGIASSLFTQRMNAQSIFEALRDEVKLSDGRDIFDDENFTKSKLYHWAIKACDELSESIASSLRFIRRVQESQTDKLCREAHAHERLGVDYWAQQMKEEIFALEDLRAQILALTMQVQERVRIPLILQGVAVRLNGTDILFSVTLYCSFTPAHSEN